MRKDTVWKLSMVGDWMDCQSCDEPCGYVWFVNIEFDVKTGKPVCLNTRKTAEGITLATTDVTSWGHKAAAREQAQEYIKRFSKAAEGPLYKLKDFCKGGKYEDSLLEGIKKQNEIYKAIGLDIEKEGLPDKILWPTIAENKDYE